MIGIAAVVMALLNWRNFRGSTYGNSFLVFAIGWAIVELHTARELIFYMSGGRDFPALMAASLATTGVVVISISYYLIYRDAK
ncbi:MAG: hypothetical protein ABEJ87_03015 [Candidatus Nanohalobium sp.]